MMILKIHNRNKSVFRGEHHRKKNTNFFQTRSTRTTGAQLSKIPKITPSPKNTGIGHEDIIKNVKIKPQTTEITFPAEQSAQTNG